METRKPSILPYTAVAVIAAIVGGALVYAFGGPGKKELNQVRIERAALNTEISALTGRVGLLQNDVKSLQDKNTALKLDVERLTATLAEKEKAGVKAGGESRRTVAELEERARTLTAENDALKKKLAGMGEKFDASAAEREALARKLGAAGRTLEDAQARAAELNKSYETLLMEKTTLAERGAARRAELESTKKALEDAQNEVARLMGARGIYTVQNGDSLSTIAAFFYRDGFRWPDIFKANSFLVSHPDLIYPKQVLIIPQ